MTANGDIVRRYFDAINAKDLALANSMVAENCTIHSGGQSHSYAEAMQAEQAGQTDNPDRKYVIDELIADGDKVAARWTMMNDGSTPSIEMLSIWELQGGKMIKGQHATFCQHQ